ncbi:MAG: tetratricopeptide repeat protein [Candidatus Kapabacteria bacterium]|nr:tetratricopeptide repeat protein [Candidatus Kapabacteria bacterium]
MKTTFNIIILLIIATLFINACQSNKQNVNLSNHLDSLITLTDSLIEIEPLKAYELALNIHTLSIENKKYDYEIRALIYLGISSGNLNRFDESLKFLLRALEKAEKEGMQELIPYCLNNLGKAYFHQGYYKDGLLYLLKSVDIVSGFSSNHLKTETYQIISNFYGAFGDLATSLDYQLLAANNFLKEKDSLNLAKCYNNIGNIFLKNKNYQKALNYYNLAIDLKRNDGHNIAYTYLNIGVLYYEQKEFIKSKQYFTEAYETIKGRDSELEAIIIYNIANIELALKNINVADSLYHNALLLFQQSGNKLGEIDIYVAFADMNKLKGNYRKSIDYYTKVLDFFKIQGMNEEEINVIQSIAEIYTLQGKNDLANLYQQRYISIIDSLRLNEQTKALKMTEAKYQAELQFQYMKKEKEILDIKYKNTFTLLIVIILSIIFVAVLVIILIKQRRIKINLKREVLSLTDTKEEVCEILNNDFKNLFLPLTAHIIKTTKKDDTHEVFDTYSKMVVRLNSLIRSINN